LEFSIVPFLKDKDKIVPFNWVVE